MASSMNATAGSVCCLALSFALGPQKVAFPGSTAYASSLASYFSVQQESVHPSCVVAPQTVQDVSTTVKALDEDGLDCLFAIRSGGHTSWAGASNVEGGPVLDLRALDSVTLGGNSTVSAGVGATWDDVYEALDPYGLSVNGGRAAGVGVGGLTLGGGISYFSPRYGWTCDTALKFEVVLANGSIVQADASQPDLLWALKGGNNNFGIVTSITFATFPQSLVWSGTLYHLAAAAEDSISEFVRINSATVYDEYASIMTSFAYDSTENIPLVANLLAYTKDVSETPAIFEGYFSLSSISSSTAVINMTTLSQQTAATNPSGYRSINLVSTLVSTEAVLKSAHEAWNTSYPAITDVSNITYTLTFEPLPPIFYQRHATQNTLGLANYTDSLVVALITVTWTDASDDCLVYDTAHALLNDMNSRAQRLGGLNRFIYANYASKIEDVIESYGSSSVQRLRKVKQEVDPSGMFTHRVPGGYKIPDS